MPTKRPTVHVVVDAELKADIRAWAERENVTQSTLCFELLKAAVRQQSGQTA